jgi:glucokinase
MPTAQPIIPVNQSQAPYFAGVDIGGTNIKIGLVDNCGQTLAFDSIITNEHAGPQQAVERSAETIGALAAKAGLSLDSIVRVGLGAPGTMCLKRGMLLDPPNLPNWHYFALQAAFEAAIQKPVSFINDANAAAFGEFWVGKGAKHDSLALLTLGTGVGGGIIVEGKLINGVNSFGSECGHLIVDSRPDARLCVWGGGRGHLEAYASASAVAARAEEELRKGAVSSLSQILMHGKAITAKRVYEAALIGDAFSLKIIDETARYLGVGVTSIVHTTDPGLVVLGGAMNFGGSGSPIGERFLEGIRAEFKERTFSHVFEGTTITFATLGGDAGYLGAAGTARHDELAGSQSTGLQPSETLAARRV